MPEAAACSTFNSQSRQMHLGRLEHTADFVSVDFNSPQQCLSSACWNGGLTQASHFLNLRVDSNGECLVEEPTCTLSRFAGQLEFDGQCVGMMTAASMNSMRFAELDIDGQYLAALVTVGLQNARRAGDPAEQRTLPGQAANPDTINLAVFTDCALSPEAMAETLMLATEAKVAALQDQEVRSSISGDLATGTGTDAIAIFSDPQGLPVRYTGKHTFFGEQLGRLVLAVVRASVARTKVAL